MMSKEEKASLLSVYRHLPQTNCGECGAPSCMVFASKLLNREATLEDCSPLMKPKYKEQMARLTEMLAPPVKEVIIGVGENAVKIGGKEVMYRHELTYHNPTAIAIDISDTMEDKKIVDRCNAVESFILVRIGERLKLNMIALRCKSKDPDRFAFVASLIEKSCKLPLILCSFDPNILKVALEKKEIADKRPLLYAATEDNWREMVNLSKHYDCPLTVFAPNNITLLKSMTRTLKATGIHDMVIDLGTYTEGKLLKENINNLVMVRRAAILRRDQDLGYPIMCIPATVWVGEKLDPVTTSYREAYVASLFIDRYSDLLVMHTMDIWSLIPVLTLRQNIYTDPRKPVSVESGLRTIGSPDEESPLLLTTNFALTYYTVINDMESSGIDCYLLVVDTEGLAVEVSVAGGQFTSANVKDLFSSVGIEEKVRHHKLIIPGLAARLKGDIEDATNWEVLVGPRDSSQIKSYLAKNWTAR
ncbi:MAG: acetyl-CoA decarbonylase/synthase complex subunit gamma [Candidatus Methylarchaceae archaeon HK02M2]|nr:acetyl-CoA decarbonylase/synthase complex subunit gamma [Candidatus Methylarchaceae archaeon HK02M2]